MAGAAAAAAAMRQRKTAATTKKKKMEKQKSRVSVVGGKLDTSSLLAEFQALTDELDLDNDEQARHSLQRAAVSPSLLDRHGDRPTDRLSRSRPTASPL